MRSGRDVDMLSPALIRAMDLVVCVAAAVVLSPFVLATALAVRVILGRPVLFRQQRPGLGGRSFEMIKFRTMRDQRDSQGDLLPDEVRLGRFGRWLRETSLDELPEIYNVIRGDMSLVGPRPLLMEYLPLYTDEQRRRHEVRPGITGWAQVNGRNAISWNEKFEHDVWYVDNWSHALDLQILRRTVMSVIMREGISQQGQVTAEKFTGNRQ